MQMQKKITNGGGSRYLLSHKEREWAYTKWCEGYTQIQIAEALNVSYKTVQRAIAGKPRIRPILEYKE